jgi:hypothetical protein
MRGYQEPIHKTMKVKTVQANTATIVQAPASQAPASQAPASQAPASQEGAGGKGNIHGGKSKAQYAADYAKDAKGLVTALTGLGALVTPQLSKAGNVICYRFRASIKSLIASRNQLAGDDRKRASAAIDAATSVADFFDGEFITLTYWLKSGGGSFAARKTASAKHKTS